MRTPAEIEADGRAKLAEFFAGQRDGYGVSWLPIVPVDDGPRCERCGGQVEIEDAHRELLGVMTNYPRVEWRCDPVTLRAHRERQNGAARARGDREPFRNL